MSAVPIVAVGRIRSMQAADLETVAKIEREAYDFPWTYGVFIDCLRAGYGGWVYEVAGEIRGYTVLSSGAGEAHLLNLCVDQHWQGEGVGRRLLAYALDQAERLGAAKIFLEVRPSNEQALALYRAMEFREIGRRRGYYPLRKGREDALVLAKSLSVDD